ncbi:MAG: fumarate hydratase [Thermodesulfobacteriota bacterium]
MKNIPAQEVYTRVKDMITHVTKVLPGDVLDCLQESLDKETHPQAREILGQLLQNAQVAATEDLPLCQDTGAAVFFVDMGEGCRIEGESLKSVLTRAMVDGYNEGYLRKSICDPFTRKNTMDNTPAFVHTELVPGDGLTIRFMAKGGGSENMSRCTMLTPAAGWQGIKDFVLQRIKEAGPNPCPPTIVGLGIGGTFDMAPILAKQGLFRPLDTPNPDPDLDSREKELLEEINSLGVGPMGLGGRTTSLGVKIQTSPCHIASLPVAVNIQCHSSRYKEVSL